MAESRITGPGASAGLLSFPPSKQHITQTGSGVRCPEKVAFFIFVLIFTCGDKHTSLPSNGKRYGDESIVFPVGY